MKTPSWRGVALPVGARPLREAARGVAWFLRGVVREDAYEKYLEHAATHPGIPVMTEREFWRDLTDRQDRNPQGRCC